MHKRCSNITVKKMFTGMAKLFRIIGDPDNQRPDNWSYNLFPWHGAELSTGSCLPLPLNTFRR